MRTASILSLLIVMLYLQSCDTVENHVTKEPPSDWFVQQRAFPYGKINKKAYVKAVAKRKELLSGARMFDKEWNFVGPTNIGGRITDLEMWPDDTQNILAGSASGGIFHSPDQGQSWIPIFDDQPSLAIGDIDISESNSDHIYVGTGEANCGGGSLAYDGLGVFKSEDRGSTWEHLGLEDVGSIGRVAIDPFDENRVYVAAMGRLFGNNNERGIYRTIDGGNEWEQVLFVSDSTGGIDLEIHPENPEIIFAAMWERTRRTNNIVYGGETSGIYRSMDGGDNWELLEGGLPTLAVSKGRMALAIAPSNPNKVYVYVADQIGFNEGVYVSEDLGNTWTSIPTEGMDNVSFQWWFSKLFVNPMDEDDVYIASFNMRQFNRSTQTWDQIFQGVHVDHHALFIHPENPNLIINGNDGGIYISQNGGLTNEKVLNLPNNQFYACEIDPNDTERVYGGMQDNGTWGNWTGNETDWFRILGGDGFRSIVEPGNSDLLYCEFQNGNIFRVHLNDLDFFTLDFSDEERFNWNTPLAIDYNNPSTIYVGSHRVIRSEDRGENLEVLSNDLTDGPYDGNRTFGTIVSLEVSRVDSDIIYAGTDDGHVWNSLDRGSSWNKVDPGMATARWTTSVLPDPLDDQVAYATFSGFRYDSNDGHVYKTEDNGQTWNDITGDLPDIPVNDVQVDLNDNSKVFVATDIGVFYSINDGLNWQMLGTGLPNVPVIDIDLEHDGKLLAATYGRSLYYYIVPEVTSTEDQTKSSMVKISPNPVSQRLNISLDPNLDYGSMAIFALSGQKIKELRSKHSNIDVSELKSGIYLLKVLDIEGTIVGIEKFIVP